MFNEGKYAEAADLYEQLLQAGFEIPGTHCHLARISLLTDRPDDARRHAASAWDHRAKAPPHVLPRILWFQLATSDPTLRSTRSDDRAALLGRLKTALQVPNAHAEWTMSPVLDHLKPTLTPGDHALLTALVAALSDASNLPALDSFPAWRAASPLAVD